jgi:hypothetical protein
MGLEITDSLKKSLRELYFRESCHQRGWAYSDLQGIRDNLRALKNDSIVVFQKGDEGVQVKIMKHLAPEIIDVCQIANNRHGASNFVFDYLACNVKNASSGIIVASPDALCWVILRTGSIIFSEEQVEVLSKTKLSVAVFQVRDVLAPPRNVETKWEIKPGSKWLDVLDERKEQEEYDDEYF